MHDNWSQFVPLYWSTELSIWFPKKQIPGDLWKEKENLQLKLFPESFKTPLATSMRKYKNVLSTAWLNLFINLQLYLLFKYQN